MTSKQSALAEIAKFGGELDGPHGLGCDYYGMIEAPAGKLFCGQYRCVEVHGRDRRSFWKDALEMSRRYGADLKSAS